MIEFDLSIYEDPMEEVFEGAAFTEITKANVIDQRRWVNVYENVYEKVVLHCGSQTYWSATWCEGATEMQDVDNQLRLVKVAPKQIVTTVYEKVKE